MSTTWDSNLPANKLSSTADRAAASKAATHLAPPVATAMVPTCRRTGRRVGQREIANFTAQIALMTRSGIDIATALHSLARQCRRPAVKAIITDVHRQVLGGKAFSAALRQYESVFGGTYVASVAAGEASGRMPEVLGHLSQLLRNQLQLRSTLRTLMAYPVLLGTVSIMVLMGLVLFVLPQFAKVFDQYEMPLPAITELLIAVATELRARFWLWGPVLASPLVAAVWLSASQTGKDVRDRLLLEVPVVRDVSRVLLTGRVCRVLGLMLASGVPLLESLRLSRSACDNGLFRSLLDQLQDDVINGRSIHPTLLECPFLPEAAVDTLITAEQTGNLANVTQLLGEHFQQEGESKLREIVAVLEPAMTVIMGVVVALVVLAVMLPMFDLTTFAQNRG
jgi:type II secretory pathway component PulF